ncbi:dihydrofolate reductase type 3 [Candidatus Photodesmus katoptron]|uniref:Dihydrofolate reductase n=1 Tax=Candidatus Photodesmus katoptron Akat1 TaxID=1236703 RepID=S3DJF3_9GAMM|nr:type 3 dihydrofolate reductase [Candidatus Photodesmus katoptron]EPE37269.1 dihydrofolate reductase type [Candidatus Photodesmus katoptron Akat1]KEY90074.1 dihydrofolate reductase type 3 [Candidatus Photodesmus katoptron]
MLISMISAITNDRTIGNANKMLWYLPADFSWFKRCTIGKPIIMGRKTFESIGYVLPERKNIVLTRDKKLRIEGVLTAFSLDEALEVLGENVNEVMIIGGASIYQSYLSRAQRLYLTHVNCNLHGDAYFPDWGTGWSIVYKKNHFADKRNSYDMTFLILERNI